MPVERKYCMVCGERVTNKHVEERMRDVCSSCGTVFYDNPLPVAAAVVLDEQRRVLLVKRRNEPFQREWCLPMGFAEMAETIEEASRRELKEETGVEGEVLGLLDVDSAESDFYGDLLIVTYALEKVGGIEEASDDAAEVRYFSLDELPELPFRSNRKAIEACRRSHRDDWAIRDSFVSLQAARDENMLSDQLVALIEQNAVRIAEAWLAEIRKNEATLSYRLVDADDLLERGRAAISQFGRWLKGAESVDEIRTFYLLLARERKQQGVEIHELLSSLSLLKKHAWDFARARGMWERPIDMYRVLELSRRMAAFFDKAMVYSARGFG